MKKLLITTTALVALCAHAKAETLNVLEEGVLVSHGKGFEAVHGETQVQPGDLIKVQKTGKAELVSKDGKTVSLNQGVTRVSNNLFLDPSEWMAKAQPQQFSWNGQPNPSAQSSLPQPTFQPPTENAAALSNLGNFNMLGVIGVGAVVGGTLGGLAATGNLGNSSSNNNSNNDAAVLAIAASQNKVSR